MLKFGSLFDDFDDLSIYKKGNKTILVYEVVGINKEDLKVQLMSKNGENKIIITGETENDITESTMAGFDYASYKKCLFKSRKWFIICDC